MRDTMARKPWKSLSLTLLSLISVAAHLMGTCGSAQNDERSCDENSAPKSRFVDLTYVFDDGTIYWPTEPNFRLERKVFGITERGYFYAANFFQAPEHGGTHLDAPIHFHQKGQTVDQIPLERLIGPGAVVDVSAAAAKDPDYLVTTEDIRRWEARQRKRVDGHIVLLRTGWGKYWPLRAKYLGTEKRGADALKQLHFPGLSPEAARWLVRERQVKAVGIDTASIDHGPSQDFTAHVILASHQVPVLENLANLDRLPEAGFTVLALPMKIRGGSGAPLRAVAVLDGPSQEL
jgi:kynurenine formamidase